MCDSPPRGRGRRRRCRGRAPIRRLTPAWAGKTIQLPRSRVDHPTHPRVGGEDVTNNVPKVHEVDSPPRGRGRQRCRRRARRVRRLTPAWAGKTTRNAGVEGGVSTHPRVGGEDPSGIGGSRGHLDSPPRGRGRQPSRHRRRLGRRLTPAWAGKTLGLLGHHERLATHPRVGGEDRRARGTDWTDDDSPPRGRGRLERSNVHFASHRLTPAWAGKTFNLARVTRLFLTHPRVGGEDNAGTGAQIAESDSPPRGRGRHFWQQHAHPGFRLTPAWAGKTNSLSPTLAGLATHPRVGGEDHAGPRRPGAQFDSPPRGRGRRPVGPPGPGLRRLTPAWAGKTGRRRRRRRAGTTHPRVGGEDNTPIRDVVAEVDSPPRGRGRRPRRDGRLPGRRLTPAWAGKTYRPSGCAG